MDKQIEAAALTNALTDIIVRVSEKDMEELGLEKAVYRDLQSIDQENFFSYLSGKEKSECYAGSPANTIMNLSLMGINTALLGTLGNDIIGKNYQEYLKKVNVNSLIRNINGESGLCYILLTPDNERTAVANVGVAEIFDFPIHKLKSSKVFHTSGYEVISNPPRALETLGYAKSLGSKISFDLAAANVIRKNRSLFEDIVDIADILFMTEEEASELFLSTPEKALKIASKKNDFVALKKGARGSIVQRDDERYEIPIFPVNVASTCGAGDAYASGFIYGYLNNWSLNETGLAASKIASIVCGLNESHLTQEYQLKLEKKDLLSVYSKND